MDLQLRVFHADWPQDNFTVTIGGVPLLAGNGSNLLGSMRQYADFPSSSPAPPSLGAGSGYAYAS